MKWLVALRCHVEIDADTEAEAEGMRKNIFVATSHPEGGMLELRIANVHLSKLYVKRDG